MTPTELRALDTAELHRLRHGLTRPHRAFDGNPDGQNRYLADIDQVLTERNAS